MEIILALGHIQVWEGKEHCIKLEFSWYYPFFSYSVYQTTKVRVAFVSSFVFNCTELPVKAPFPSTVGIPGFCLNNTFALNHLMNSFLPVICCFVCLWYFLRSSCTFLCVFQLSAFVGMWLWFYTHEEGDLWMAMTEQNTEAFGECN